MMLLRIKATTLVKSGFKTTYREVAQLARARIQKKNSD